MEALSGLPVEYSQMTAFCFMYYIHFGMSTSVNCWSSPGCCSSSTYTSLSECYAFSQASKSYPWDFPGGSVVKNLLPMQKMQGWPLAGNARVEKIPWRRKWQLTPVFLPGKSHGQRSLAGYSPGSPSKCVAVKYQQFITWKEEFNEIFFVFP